MLDILYFPIWWYTSGLKKRFLGFLSKVRYSARYFALKVLIVNLFKPMFGQYDLKGRVISFFMRCIILVVHFTLFLISLIFFLSLLIIWILLPIFAIFQIVKLLFF
jgi:hypothetical protein